MTHAPFAATDPGLEILGALYSRFVGDDARYAVVHPRRFCWWGHRLMQDVRVELPRTATVGTVSRLRISTTVLVELPAGTVSNVMIDRLNQRSILSGFRRCADGRLVSECSLLLSRPHAHWVRPTALAAAGLQLALAEHFADSMIERTGGGVAVSAPPGETVREEPDLILGLHEQLYQRTGEDRPDFGPLLAGFAGLLASRGARASAVDGRFVMDAPVMIGNQAHTVIVSVGVDFDPRVGHGARLSVWLPPLEELTGGPARARDLQAAEASARYDAQGIGAWFWDPHQHRLGCTLLVPRVHCENERLFNLMIGMGERARWALARVTGRP